MRLPTCLATRSYTICSSSKLQEAMPLEVTASTNRPTAPS
jgi:hypothetical protein